MASIKQTGWVIIPIILLLSSLRITSQNEQSVFDNWNRITLENISQLQYVLTDELLEGKFPVFSPDSRYLTYSNQDIYIEGESVNVGIFSLDMETGDVNQETNEGFGSLAYNPSGELLAYGIRPNVDAPLLPECFSALQLLNTIDHTPELTIQQPYGWIVDIAYGSSVVATTSGVYGSGLPCQGNSVRLWSLETGEQLAELNDAPDPTDALTFNFELNLLVTAGNDGFVMWDISNPELPTPITRFEFNMECGVHAHDVAFSQDGNLLAFALSNSPQRCEPTETYVASIQTDNLLQNEITGAITTYTLQEPIKDSSEVLRVAFHPDATILATLGVDGVLRLFDVSNGQQLHAIEVADQRGLSLEFSPDGRFIAVHVRYDNIQLLGVLSDEE